MSSETVNRILAWASCVAGLALVGASFATRTAKRNPAADEPNELIQRLEKAKSRVVSPDDMMLARIIASAEPFNEIREPHKHEWRLYEHVPLRLLKPGTRQDYLTEAYADEDSDEELEEEDDLDEDDII